MSVREKGPRSAWSSPTRPFSRPVRRADRAETGGLYVCSLALHYGERLAGGGKWIRTISTWKISDASFSAFGCVAYLMSL